MSEAALLASPEAPPRAPPLPPPPPRAPPTATAAGWLRCMGGIVAREALRVLGQRGRFLSALVRPLVWLAVFAAGFRFVLGVSIAPPYDTYVLYEEYIVPGLCAMVLLFGGMQSSLSMVYDREVGSMRALLTSPFPRWWLLASRLVASALVGAAQAYAFLAVAWFWEVRPPAWGYLAVLPFFLLAGTMLGALGLFLSSRVSQLENFAGVMNFVIFPMFFASSALYPLWRVKESSLWLWYACLANPFTHAVEAIRFALYLRPDPAATGATLLALLVFGALAVRGYDPGRGLLAARRGGPPG